MIVPDLNVLIYAVNEESVPHRRAYDWWPSCVNGSETIGLPWLVLLGFLRLTTSQRIFPSPLTPHQAWEFSAANQ